MSKMSKLLSFQVIVDSGATSHMFPYRQAFISYCETPGGYILLADQKKAPSIGIGSVCFSIGGHFVQLCNVLHVPVLCAPLFSVQRHLRSSHSSFVADNDGILLAFPSFCL